MKTSEQRTTSAPTLTHSIFPVAFMLLSLVTIVIVFGGQSISDFSPWVLLTSAIFAIVLAAATRTLSRPKLIEGFRRGAKQTLPAVPLLILIAMISTTWLLSGVVPTLVDLGIRYLNPTLFLVTTCAVCAIVSVLTGSSWSTIATIGVAFIGIGKIMGYSEAWIAGAIISGAYFGDKVSPLSDTTLIASSSCNVDLFDHIRNLLYTAVPAMTIAMITFFIVGLISSPDSTDLSTLKMIDDLHEAFVITPYTLIIPAIVSIMIAMRVKTLYTLAAGTVLGIAGIFIFQPDILATIEGSSLHTAGQHVTATLRLLWTETSVPTDNEHLASLLTTGGITGMLPTVLLVVCAMTFGGAMLGTGMLATIAEAITRRLSHRKSIVGATVASGLFLNSCTADQYLSIIIGGNMYRDVYRRNNLQPKLLSRTLEDSVSVTSVLIPWNSCGITQSTVLGVATLTYLPCCVFNLLSPLMSLLFAWLGFKIPQLQTTEEVTGRAADHPIPNKLAAAGVVKEN